MNGAEKVAWVLLAVWFLESVAYVLEHRREAAADEAERRTRAEK